MVMRLMGICLITEDVPALAAFYARVTGATVEGDETHAEVHVAGAGLAIMSARGMEELAPGSMQGAGHGGVAVTLCVDDVDAEHARLVALGVPVVKPPLTHSWGARSAWFRDPDGNIVSLYAQVA